MVALLFSVELEILNELTAADREKLMTEAAEAYRDRGRCLQAIGRSEAAASVFKHAEDLDQEARKLTQAKTAGQIELINRWSGGAVTMLIDGQTIQLAAGETKLLPKPAGAFRYEIPASKQTSTGQVEAGKVFRLQIK